jgi:RNA polymerase-binding transcription factor DksA
MEELKEYYLSLKEEIMRNIKSLSEREIDASGDDVDQIQARALTRITECLGQRDIIKLRRLDYALTCIEKDTIDECESCSEPIGIKRLKLMPGIRVCVICAEKSEIKRR